MRRAMPPVGWQSMTAQEPQTTTLVAWLKTVVMDMQPGHLTSMKKELGDCTSLFFLCMVFWALVSGRRRSTRGCKEETEHM